MAQREDVLAILGKYVDLSYQETHKNSRGVNVVAYFDGRDSRYMYGKQLESIGFERIYNSGLATDWFNEQLLCSVTYCEHDLYYVVYENVEQYKSELSEAIKFNERG